MNSAIITLIEKNRQNMSIALEIIKVLPSSQSMKKHIKGLSEAIKQCDEKIQQFETDLDHNARIAIEGDPCPPYEEGKDY